MLEARQGTLFSFTGNSMVRYIAQCVVDIVRTKSEMDLNAPILEELFAVVTKSKSLRNRIETVALKH